MFDQVLTEAIQNSQNIRHGKYLEMVVEIDTSSYVFALYLLTHYCFVMNWAWFLTQRFYVKHHFD